jgi:flagellar basal body-associated protein FliL
MSKLFISIVSLVVIYIIVAMIIKLPPFKKNEKYSDTPYKKLISYCDYGKRNINTINDDVY